VRKGYREVRVVGGPGDLNADIIARDAQGRRVVVQCKQYAPANRIGSPTIQTFIGMVHVHHKAQIGIFVTTSSYTDAALDLARQHGLIVYDGSDLGRMMARSQNGAASGRAWPRPASATRDFAAGYDQHRALQSVRRRW
jgi:restriction system protein